MTASDLMTVLKGIAPVVREYVSTALSGHADRLSALEQRAATPGPAGERGEKGDPGANGEAGRDGIDGKDGRAGIDGKDGSEGPRGAQGAAGEKGLDGTHGRDGRDGLPGTPGAMGEKGLAGTHGADGVAGKDGRDGTLENLVVDYDGERTVRFCFKNGDPIQGGVIVLPIVIYRGVYEETKTYYVGDSVTWGGSQWIAKEVTTAKPGTAPAAWQLAVKKGADGKQGPVGAAGERGLKGEKGDRGWSQ